MTTCLICLPRNVTATQASNPKFFSIKLISTEQASELSKQTDILPYYLRLLRQLACFLLFTFKIRNVFTSLSCHYRVIIVSPSQNAWRMYRIRQETSLLRFIGKEGRVTRGKAALGVKRQTGIFAKPRNIIRITGLMRVGELPKPPFCFVLFCLFVYGASSFSSKRSMFN